MMLSRVAAVAMMLAAGGGAAAAQAAEADSLLPRADRGRQKGAADAPVTVVEVSDFQCPFCRQFTETSYRQLDSVYVRAGRVRMVFINFPLPGHRLAYPAAEAAMCAAAQGQFWPMHDRIFAAQSQWSAAGGFTAFAEAQATALRLDLAAFRDCTQHDRTAPLIVSDVMSGAGAGIQGTPTLVITGPGGQRLLSGAVAWEELRGAIEQVMTAPAASPPPPPN